MTEAHSRDAHDGDSCGAHQLTEQLCIKQACLFRGLCFKVMCSAAGALSTALAPCFAVARSAIVMAFVKRCPIVKQASPLPLTDSCSGELAIKLVVHAACGQQRGVA